MVRVCVCEEGGGGWNNRKTTCINCIDLPYPDTTLLDSNTFNRTRNKRLQLKYLFKIDPSQAIVLCQLRVNVKKY